MNQDKQWWERVLRRWGPLTLSIAVVVGAVLYLEHSGTLDDIDLRAIRWEYFALMIPARLIAFIINGLTLAAFTAHLGLYLDFAEWFGLTMAGTLLNSIIPISGGAMTRAGYLKARYNFPVSHYSALLAATSLITYLVGGAVGLILLAGLSLSTRQPFPWLPAGVMAGMIAMPLLLIALPLERLPIPLESRIMRWVHTALDGWHEIRTSPALLIKQIVLALAAQLTQAVILNLGMLALGWHVPLVHTLFVGILSNIARATPSTGLGVREAVAALGASLVGISPALGFAAATLLRLAGWIPVLTLGPLYVFILSRRVPFLGGVAARVNHIWKSAETPYPER